MKTLSIRCRYDTLENIDVPEPTFSRHLTYHFHSGFLELIYWLDKDIHTAKQLHWLADIKVRIRNILPDAEFIEYDKDCNYITENPEPYTLATLSSAWRAIPKIDVEIDSEKEVEDMKEIWNRFKEQKDVVAKSEPIKLPKLPTIHEIDIMVEGDSEKIAMKEIYQPLCIHCKNLHYYRVLNFEYVLSAAIIMADRTGAIVSRKNITKVATSAFDSFSAELERNPKKYKQKLIGQDKIDDTKRRTVLLASARATAGAKSIEANRAKVSEALLNPLATKADGTPITTAIATLTGLHRKTVSRILKSI